MSHTDDTNPNRGRPVLRRLEQKDLSEDFLGALIANEELWKFCGEYEGSEAKAADGARERHGKGIYKVFPSGSWPGGYLRD